MHVYLARVGSDIHNAVTMETKKEEKNSLNSSLYLSTASLSLLAAGLVITNHTLSA
jgi:hypothetical protein